MSPDPIQKQAQRLWPRWFIAGTKPVKVDLGPAGAAPLVDISGGGFRVQSLAPLRRGAEVPVRIEIPDHPEPLQCTGIVVWSKPNGAAGVRFASLTDSQKAVLQGWLAELEAAATAPAHAQIQDEFTSVVSQIRGAQLNSADALNMVVRRAKELNSVSGAAIALGTPESMTCMAAAGEAPKIGSNIPAVIGITGECVFKRKMVHCEDSKNDPRVGRESTFGSAVILPLIVNNEVRGVLQVFSKRSYAFTATTIDSLEKLADAVIFVTHGIVTQRRLATAKASLSATSTNISLGPKPAVAPAPNTGSWTAPAPAHTASHDSVSISPSVAAAALRPLPVPNTIAASAAVVPVARVEPLAVASIAEPIAAPIAAPAPRPNFQPQARRKPAPRSQTHRREAYRPPRQSSSGKWIAIVVVLAVGAASGWFYVNHQKHAVPVQAAESVSSSSPEAPAETQPVQNTHSAKPNVISAKAATSSAVVPATAVAAHPAPPVAKHEEKPVVPAKPEATPEPIILSANTPKGPQPVDLDTVVPVKLPTTFAEPANTTQIALPAAAKAAPKLAVAPPVVRTDAILVKRVNPIYPPVARNAHIQGVVEVQLHIGKDGSVTRATRLSGPSMLGSAAVDAVKQWRFEPAKANGEPVETDTTVKLTFELYH